jgi:hypothetical protein
MRIKLTGKIYMVKQYGPERVRVQAAAGRGGAVRFPGKGAGKTNLPSRTCTQPFACFLQGGVSFSEQRSDPFAKISRQGRFQAPG